MYNSIEIEKLTKFIHSRDGIDDKTKLALQVQNEFGLIKDRSVFYGEYFAIRFCKAANKRLGNTVLSLSSLRKYDNKPFIVCAVTPKANYLMLANTTFLKKISHSSQELRMNNIKGSFNGSDIMDSFEGIENNPQNFEQLFISHENYTFEENLERLVENTNNIHPTGERFAPSKQQLLCIKDSVRRAAAFLKSEEYSILNNDLQSRVDAVSSEIAIAARIENVNLRGRVIEYLITSPDERRHALADALHNNSPLPQIFTKDELGDYQRDFGTFRTAIDIKTKMLFLSSNPKGYNIDKLLRFLAEDDSVYLIYVAAIDDKGKISTKLCSMYNRQLLNATRIISQWAGRNSRGVTQYIGDALKDIVSNFDSGIDISAANAFIERCINI